MLLGTVVREQDTPPDFQPQSFIKVSLPSIPLLSRNLSPIPPPPSIIQ